MEGQAWNIPSREKMEGIYLLGWRNNDKVHIHNT